MVAQVGLEVVVDDIYIYIYISVYLSIYLYVCAYFRALRFPKFSVAKPLLYGFAP